MKRIFLYLLLFTFSFGYSQTVKKHAKYYTNGNASVRGQFNSNLQRTGTWTFYYIDGTVLMQGKYIGGMYTGEWFINHSNGNTFLKGKFSEYRHVKNSKLVYAILKENWTSYWNDGTVANIYSFTESGVNVEVVNPKYINNYKYSSGKYGKGMQVLIIDFLINSIGKPTIRLDENIIKNNRLSIGTFNRHGHWKEYNANGRLSAEGSYNWKTNSSYGPWKTYYNSGKLKSDRTFTNGTLNGYYKEYLENGIVKDEGYYENGKETGRWTELDKNGNLSKGKFIKGKREAVWEYYDKSNTLFAKSTYVNGIIHGPRYYYHKNGTVKSAGEYKNSKKQGLWVSYFENGNTRLIEKFRNNKLSEIIHQKLKDGTTILNDGNGIYRTFHTNGRVRFEAEMTNGSRSGKATWYYDNGQIETSAFYKHDMASKPSGLRWKVLSSFHKNGSTRAKGSLTKGNGTWIQYDQNGNISKTDIFKNGYQTN